MAEPPRRQAEVVGRPPSAWNGSAGGHKGTRGAPAASMEPPWGGEPGRDPSVSTQSLGTGDAHGARPHRVPPPLSSSPARRLQIGEN